MSGIPMLRKLDAYGDVLTIEELAMVLRTSTRTIRRLIRAGTCPIRQLHGIDKRVRYARGDVERYLLHRK